MYLGLGRTSSNIAIGARFDGNQLIDFFNGKVGALKLYKDYAFSKIDIAQTLVDPYVVPTHLHKYCIGEWDLNNNYFEFSENLNDIHGDSTVCEYDWTTAESAFAKDKSYNDLN